MTREEIVSGIAKMADFFKARADMAVGDGKMLLLNWMRCAEEAAEVVRAQEPLTEEVKWQERHRKSYRQYTGFDAMGDKHTVTVCEESDGREPYCGKCSAQLAESFINYCPRCGVKLIIPNPTAEQREAEPWRD